VTQRIRALPPLVFALLAISCTATAVRRYEEPLAYTQFAAQQACVMAGFELTRIEPDEIQGERPIRIGLLLGQGGEHVRVGLLEASSGTQVEITSRKRFFYFFGARHRHEQIAAQLDRLIVADRELRDRILGGTP
jgi:hypothetical protein